MTNEHLEQALARLDEAALHISIAPETMERLRLPRELVKMRLTIRMDDGTQRSFQAWRCRYDDTRGPTKGGIRFHPDTSAAEVEALAFWMTVKCAVAELPFGGGKGAVRVDPKTLSRMELERLSRAYIRAFANVVGPERDIPAPDVGTNPRIMGWMAREYNAISARVAPGVITGKPVALGGSLGREDATARGGFELLRHLEARLGLEEGKRRAVIQGFGNAGGHLASLLAESGWTVVGASDSTGAVANPQGLDIPELTRLKAEGGSLRDAVDGGTRAIDADRLLALESELFVPAALQEMIHRGNAERLAARTVLELANGPVTPEADLLLAKKGVTVLPDILANAGGVIVSYFEWAQNREGQHWSLDDVRTRLADIMRRQGDLVWQTSLERKISLRTAAYVVGLSRLVEAIEATGTADFFSR